MLVTFYQPELEALLRRKLESLPTVEVQLGVELSHFTDEGTGVPACLKWVDGSTRQVRARYLVGCDGANSTVRQILGLDFKGASFAQDWLIVDALGVPNPIDHCEFICDPRRPTPHMVAPGGRQRWEFMLQPGETREEMERPETIRRLLAQWCDSKASRSTHGCLSLPRPCGAGLFQGALLLGRRCRAHHAPFAGQGLVAGLATSRTSRGSSPG